MRGRRKIDRALRHLAQEQAQNAAAGPTPDVDAAWRKVQERLKASAGPNPETEALIEGYLAGVASAEESQARAADELQNRRRRWTIAGAAAASFLIVAFTLYYVRFVLEQPAEVLSVTGTWTAGLKNESLAADASIESGSVVQTDRRGALVVDAGEGLRLVLRGPGRFVFVRTNADSAPKLDLMVGSGEVVVHGVPGQPRDVTLTTPRALYALKGTTLRLQVQATADELAVAEGAVAVLNPTTGAELTVVAGGSAARTDARLSPEVRPLPVQQQKEIEAQADDAVRGESSPPRRYTEAELRALPGNFVELELADGTKIRGHEVDKRPGVFVILTEDGETRTFYAAEVLYMRILHD